MSKNETKETKKLLVAIDDGYAQTKLYGEDENGNIIKFCMRSSVRSGRWGLGDISGSGAVGLYDTEEGSFTVSEDIASESTKFDGFHLSTMNRVLVNHALISAGYAGKEVEIIAGLPVADYFTQGVKDETKIAAKKANLLKPIKVSNGSSVNIKEALVGCQAVAAWVDYVYDDNLNERVSTDGAVAIIDIGGRTTDIATVISNEDDQTTKVDYQRSGTADIGVLDVYNASQSAITSQFKIKDELPTKLIDKAVRTGKIKLFGKEHDVKELIAPIITEHEAKIFREIERRIGSGAQMNAVIFVGGGGALFQKIAANHFPLNGHMIDDPEFANARGLFKFARSIGQG